MNTVYKTLKTAAAKLEKMAELLDQAGSDSTASSGEVAKLQSQLKTAQDALADAKKQQKVAADAQKAAVGERAIKVASKLLEVGMLSSQKQADVFANNILDQRVALEQFEKLAGHIEAPRVGQVVLDKTASDDESADAVYERHARAALSRIDG